MCRFWVVVSNRRSIAILGAFQSVLKMHIIDNTTHVALKCRGGHTVSSDVGKKVHKIVAQAGPQHTMKVSLDVTIICNLRESDLKSNQESPWPLRI